VDFMGFSVGAVLVIAQSLPESVRQDIQAQLERAFKRDRCMGELVVRIYGDLESPKGYDVSQADILTGGPSRDVRDEVRAELGLPAVGSAR
jgi:hypothetical protein